MSRSLPKVPLSDESIIDDEFDFGDEFDPLEDTNPDLEDESYEESVAYIGAPELVRQPPQVAPTETADKRPAEERIAELLTSMAPRRKVLLGILAFCQMPQPVAIVNTEVDRLQENNFSVYTAANFCTLLEQAGAIQRVTQDGDDFSQVKTEPRVVEVDGVEYLEPGTPPEAYWLDTDEGRAALEADKPLERLTALFAADTQYLPIYKRVLSLCAQEGGQTAKGLGDAVDSDPLVQKPRLYAPRFVDRLEKCDALTWAKAWVTTDIGAKGLAMLEAVADDYTPALLDTTALDVSAPGAIAPDAPLSDATALSAPALDASLSDNTAPGQPPAIAIETN